MVNGTRHSDNEHMPTLASGLTLSPWLRPKHLLFAVLGFMLPYVLVHDESFLVHPNDPIWQHYEPVKWWLLPHGVAGACALLLGPLQFSNRLRLRFAKLHRVLGRIYVAGVFVVAPLGIYIQYFEERLRNSRSFTVAAVVDAVLLMGTFAVALVFLEGRVVGGVTGWENLGSRADETIVWVCLAFSILSADLALQWQKAHRVPHSSPLLA